MWQAIIEYIRRAGMTDSYKRGRLDGWNAAVKLWNETSYPKKDQPHDR